MKTIVYLVILTAIALVSWKFQSYYQPKVETVQVTVSVPTAAYTPYKAMELACGKLFYNSYLEELGDGKFTAAHSEGVNVTLSDIKMYVILKAGKFAVTHDNAASFPSPEVASMFFEAALKESYDIVYAEAALNTNPDLTKITNNASVSCTKWTNRNLSIGAVGMLLLGCLIAIFALFATFSILNSSTRTD